MPKDNNKPKSGWDEIAGTFNGYDEEQRFWQLRISVFPEPKNLAKAAKMIRDLIEKKYAGNRPGMKVYLGGEYWDPLKKPPANTAVSDRNQVGKEICVYLEYDSASKQYQYSPQEYKDIMLDIWHALENAGVKLSYASPEASEKTVSCENGVITPFMYSAFKPYKDQRHGILGSTAYNPMNFTDPLNDVVISKQDLKDHKIKRNETTFLEVRKNRLLFQEKRLQLAREELASTLKLHQSNIDLDKKNEKKSAYEDARERLKAVLDSSDENFERNFKDLFINGRAELENLPGKCDQGLSSFVEDGQIKSFLKKDVFPIDEAKKYVNKLNEEVIAEVAAIQKEYGTEAIQSTLQELGMKPVDVISFAEKTPLFNQMIYRQLVHYENAKEAYRQELISGLDRYITRISGNKNGDKIDFTSGFHFFSKSSARSREANYKLAVQLKTELQQLKNPSLNDINNLLSTTHINDIRTKSIDGKGVRKINSAELTTIIKRM